MIESWVLGLISTVLIIVLGYFDIKLSLTVLLCTLVQSVITALCKLYWHHAM